MQQKQQDHCFPREGKESHLQVSQEGGCEKDLNPHRACPVLYVPMQRNQHTGATSVPRQGNHRIHEAACTALGFTKLSVQEPLTRELRANHSSHHLSYLFWHFPWEEEVRHRRQGHETGRDQETKPPGADPPRVFVCELDFVCNTSGEMGIKSKVNGGTPVHRRDGDGWPQSPQTSASSKLVAPNLGTISFGV